MGQLIRKHPLTALPLEVYGATIAEDGGGVINTEDGMNKDKAIAVLEELRQLCLNGCPIDDRTKRADRAEALSAAVNALRRQEKEDYADN